MSSRNWRRSLDEHDLPQQRSIRKRIEFYVVGLMLKEGLDVYLPLVDDNAIDAVVKRPDGRFVEVQIKARSRDVKFGHAGLFAALTHELRPNYWFVFYSERIDKMWIMSSREFVRESRCNKEGKTRASGRFSLPARASEPPRNMSGHDFGISSQGIFLES